MNRAMELFKGCVYRLTAILCFFFVSDANAQEFNMMDTTLTSCSGTLYDSGGPLASYGNNENLSVLIQTGGTLSIAFQGNFSLESAGDTLFIYNGTSTSAPLLGAYTGNTVPGPLTVFSGAALVVFHSDGAIPSAGFALSWSANIPVPVPPTLSVNNVPACNASQFNIQLSSPVQCAWLDDATISVSAAGNSIPVSTLLTNCAAGQTAILTVQLAQPLTYNCTYSITLNMSIPNSCGQLFPFTLGASFPFANCGVNAQLTTDQSTICPGGCASIQAEVLGCNTYQYSWSNGLPPTPGPHQVCLSETTTYLVTITEVETGNSSIETITIEVENADITTDAQTICQSGPALNLTAGVLGQWSGVGVVSGTNQFDPELVGGGLHWVYFNTQQCVDSVAITVTPIETQEITAACPGSPTFPLLAFPSGGVWDGPNTTPAGIFNPSTAGEFEVTYTLDGCVDYMTVQVDSIDGPFEFPPICQSVPSYTLIATPAGGLWSGPGVVSEGNGTFVPSLASPGNITLTYAINGCEADFSMLVKQIQVIPSIQLCPDGGSLVLDPNPLPAGGVWSSPGGAIQNSSTGLYNPGVFSGNTTSYATYTAPNGCVDSVAIEILFTDIQQSELFFCNTAAAVPLNASLVGGLNPSIGAWSGQGVSGSVANGFQFNPAAASIGQHWLFYAANGCEDSISVTIFPAGLPDSPLTFCSNDADLVLVPGLPSGGIWEGAGIINTSSGFFSPAQATIGASFVHWTTPGGCLDSIQVTVEQYVVPAITGLASTYCFSDVEVAFTAEPLGGILVGSLADYQFNVQDLGAGIYEVTYLYTPQICDPVSASTSFEIYPALDLQPISASANPLCPDESVTLSAVVTGGDPDATIEYAWSNGSPSQSAVTFTPGISQNVSLTVSDGCSDNQTEDIDLAVFSPFVINVNTSDTLCDGEMGFVSVSMFPAGTYTVVWNGESGSGNQIDVPAGEEVTIDITDDNGCAQDTSAITPVHPPVGALFSVAQGDDCLPADQMGNVGFVDESINAMNGIWDFGDGGATPYIAGENVSHGYAVAGEYEVTLTVMSPEGCVDDYAHNLCIQPQDPVFIPDIFSPNGDGKNDTLFVRGFYLTKIDFRLYNRWGEEVFQTQSLSRGWDGNLRGQPAPSGSYFYTFTAILGSKEREERSGEIILIR